jgi:hypothetical protein
MNGVLLNAQPAEGKEARWGMFSTVMEAATGMSYWLAWQRLLCCVDKRVPFENFSLKSPQSSQVSA